MPLLRTGLLLFALLLAALPTAAQETNNPMTDVSPSPNWVPFGEALETAKETGQLVVVDVYAPWCGWCDKLQEETYTDEELRAYLGDHFVMTRVDITADEPRYAFQGSLLTPKHLGQVFGGSGTPRTVFVTPDEEILTVLPGFRPPAEIEPVFAYFAESAYLTQDFAEFMADREASE